MYQPINKRTKEFKMLKQVLAKSECFSLRSKVGKYPTFIIKPSELNVDEKQAIFNAVYFVGLSAFIQNPSVGMEEDISNHLFKEDVLFVTFSNTLKWRDMDNKETRAIAFLGYRDILYKGENMLYISGICVDTAYQGNGLGSALLKASYEKGDYKIASLRTQNPVMKQCFDKIIGGVSYPKGITIPVDIKAIGKYLADMFNANSYNEDTLICEGVYGSSLYGLEINSRDNVSINNVFAELAREKGDAVFCIKQV